MVGLSVILENYRDLSAKSNPHRQVISKGSMIKPSGFSRRRPLSDLPSFLDSCLLCKRKLSPGKDIFMYKGDKAFCSEECRCRQIFMDEEEAGAARSCCTREYNCSMAAASSAEAAVSRPSGGGDKGRTSGRANGFAY